MCLATYSLGAARRAAGLAAEHARTRQIFKRKLGAFQSVRHQFADMAIAIEAGGLLVGQAFRTLGEGRDIDVFCSEAKAFANERLRDVCRIATQTMGASGFLADSPVHRLYRHALAASLIGGTTDEHLRTIGTAVLAMPQPVRLGGE